MLFFHTHTHIYTHSFTHFTRISCSSHLPSHRIASHLFCPHISYMRAYIIIHQVGNLVYASPAISSVGVVFVDSNQLGCKPFWQRWLHGRHEHQTKILQVHFVLSWFIVIASKWNIRKQSILFFCYLLFLMLLLFLVFFFIILCGCVCLCVCCRLPSFSTSDWHF